MRKDIGDYLGDLGRLMRETSCTDGAGRPLGLSEGFRRAVELLVSRTGAGHSVLFVGNGGSASIASHMATDFFKIPGVRSTAFNDSAMLTCMGNDYGYENVFARPIELLAEEGDVLVAISSSGSSPNILKAASAARSRGCAVVTLSGFAAGNPLRALGDINFWVPSGAYGPVEVVHLALCHSIFDSFTERKHGPLPD